MRPPAFKREKVFGIHELATRWTNYDCFIGMFPAHIRKLAVEGNVYVLHTAAMEMIEGYIESGEIEANCSGYVEGLIPSYKEYSILGASVEKFERECFGGCYEVEPPQALGRVMSNENVFLSDVGVFFDWKYIHDFTGVDEMTVGEAVALSLNLNPSMWLSCGCEPVEIYGLDARGMKHTEEIGNDVVDNLTKIYWNKECHPILKSYYLRLKERLEVAENNFIENGGELSVSCHPSGAQGACSVVTFQEFGAWAKSKGWSLPNEFPIDKGVVNSQSAVDGSDFDLDRDDYPDGLRIANVAWRAVAVNGQGGEGTPKQRLERWLRGSGNELSEADIGRIASVCNWDKSAGRPKGK